VHFDKNFYHSHEIDRNIMSEMHFERNVSKCIIPILGARILLMKAHKCMCIVMQIRSIILMTAYPHKVFFILLAMELLVGVGKKTLYYCVINMN
jgi:hypothetical protein